MKYKIIILLATLPISAEAEKYYCNDRVLDIQFNVNSITINSKYKAFHKESCIPGEGSFCEVFSNRAYTYSFDSIDETYTLSVENKWGQHYECSRDVSMPEHLQYEYWLKSQKK